MTKFYFREKFPCGYEVETSVSSWDSYGHFDSQENHKGCPLHGKKCKGVKK